ncbi:hypothetical protein LX36DRAFT_144616 [Colletotrichum falcatum]|nr:hypothetical protein LX36DRAFT_144616 [Colletotrichum falcatum]
MGERVGTARIQTRSQSCSRSRSRSYNRSRSCRGQSCRRVQLQLSPCYLLPPFRDNTLLIPLAACQKMGRVCRPFFSPSSPSLPSLLVLPLVLQGNLGIRTYRVGRQSRKWPVGGLCLSVDAGWCWLVLAGASRSWQ